MPAVGFKPPPQDFERFDTMTGSVGTDPDLALYWQRTFDESHMHTTGIAHLGGATLDIEENYLIKKLFTAGLGMVCLSNQARI